MKLQWNMLSTLFILASFMVGLNAQNIPTPKEHFGFEIGDNYQLATFTQTESYFKKIAAASPRAKFQVIGKTEEGRDQFMMIVTSPENQKKLDYYKSISQKMGNPQGITEEQAKAMANEGKAVVWIDGGLHSTETVATHQLIPTAYKLLSSTDPETMRILDKLIILIVHANPDGQELVTNWYMRNPIPEKRTLQGVPKLYQKYVGHDNNRDFYMLNMKESRNIAQQLFIEWIPQIMYNHHQTAPPGAVVAGAPYRDPFNYVMDPLIISGLDAIGAANQNRLNLEGKTGYTSKSGSVFSTWYNGGLRTTTYFHNMIGLLTEIIGSPTPAEVPLVTNRLIPNAATPNPVTPQKWLFKQSIDYSVSLNYAMMDYAARNSDQLLYNIYKMGMNSIERGSKDHWALSPSKIDEMNRLIVEGQKTTRPAATPDNDEMPAWLNRSTISKKYFDTVMTNPIYKDPRGFIIPSDQTDFATAVEFLNALIRTGVIVHKATADFQVNGKSYPANSYIVKTNQAFRPHVIDLFEPQDHPNDFQYPGGPPIPPYDAAGWTLAYQMGVKFDKIMEGFDGPFEKNPIGQILEIKAKLPEAPKMKGYLFNAGANNSFKVVNNLLKNNIDVFRITKEVPGSKSSVGSFFVPVTPKSKSVIASVESMLKQSPETLMVTPTSMEKVVPARIALWDVYGGSMPSGWIRWMMEQFDFPMKVVFAKEIDESNLKANYDVIVFVGGSMPSLTGGRGGANTPSADSIPEEFRHTVGRMTAEKSIPQLKKFLEEGGNIVTLGSACDLAYHLKLPVSNAITEFVNGEAKALPREKYFAPGSILKVHVDNKKTATAGMGETADVLFNNSPVFDIAPAALAKQDIVPLLWFGKEKPLKSGWTWGQHYLQNKVTGFMANVGKGKLYAYGPEITFRAQSHGTFRLLFNQLYAVK